MNSYFIFILIAIQIPVMIMAILMAKESRARYHRTRDRTRRMFISSCSMFGISKTQAEQMTEQEISDTIRQRT